MGAARRGRASPATAVEPRSWPTGYASATKRKSGRRGSSPGSGLKRKAGAEGSTAKTGGGARLSSGTGRRGGPPVAWVSGFDSWYCCGDVTGSGEAQESPAARIRETDHLPAAALRGNPGRCRCWGRAGKPRGRSGRRGEAMAMVCRGSGAVLWLVHGGAGTLRDGARRAVADLGLGLL